MNFEDNKIPYSADEIRVLSSMIVLREFRKIDSDIEDSENIIQHFLKFPTFQISTVRKNFWLSVGGNDRLSSRQDMAKLKREERIKIGVDNPDKFISDRHSFYTKLLDDFYGPRRITPFKATYMLFYEPLIHLGHLDSVSDYSEKVDTELMNIINLKLEYIRDNIFEFFIPILLI